MVILVGESGSGKSSIEKNLVNNHGFGKIVSYTTRPKREGEVDGIDYNYITEEEFLKRKCSNEFAEVAEYRGWYYGSLTKDYEKAVSKTVKVLTPMGLRQILSNTSIVKYAVTSFYIKVPRRDRLIMLLKRGDDIEEAYRRNLSEVGQFDGIEYEVSFTVVNEGYKHSVDDLTSHIIELEAKSHVNNCD